MLICISGCKYSCNSYFGRWEVIDVVRTLSTEKVKAGEEGADSFKFSRLVLFESIFFLQSFLSIPGETDSP